MFVSGWGLGAGENWLFVEVEVGPGGMLLIFILFPKWLKFVFN